MSSASERDRSFFAALAEAETQPYIHIHDDGHYIGIGFGTLPETLLKVGGQNGPAGYIDVEVARRWAVEVAALFAMYCDDPKRGRS